MKNTEDKNLEEIVEDYFPNKKNAYSKEFGIIKEFEKNLLENQIDCPSDITKIVDENFEDLLIT
jgi:hypothetical protein